MLIDTGFLYANDNSRIFINTALGCRGECLYCYLPKIGYSNNRIDKYEKAENLIFEIEKLSDINQDTLISIGCFSECLDSEIITETNKLIIYFLKKGNQVQLSTKKEMKIEDIEQIIKNIKYPGQLVIFVSCSTITEWKFYEKNTDNPQKRFKNFELINKYNIPIILYIKPVIKNVTIKDIDKYIEVIKKYNIENVVIGSIFKKREDGETVPFLNQKILFYEENEDEKKFIQILKKYCDVFRRSTQVTKKYYLKK